MPLFWAHIRIPGSLSIVNSVFRHLRPLLVSVVALILTAGIAFAAKPSTPANGLAVAGQASGKTVPVVSGGDENATPDEETESDEDTDTETNEDSGGDNCATDPATLTAEELAAATHGSIVCWAAQQDTPAEFDNHGAWVKSWATDNAGSDASGDAGSQAKDKTSGNSHAAAGLAHKK
jgi:hypothetical protein